MSVHLCIPVLRRYDLLQRLFESLKESTVKPESVMVMDNGRDMIKAIGATRFGPRWHYEIKTPPQPLGVAESWNAFLNATVGDDRIIANDDMTFAPHSIERLVGTPGDLVMGFGFSCFLIRESCVEKVGRFDEQISPGYAYFEDCDYAERVRRLNAKPRGPRVVMADAQDTGLVHGDGKDGSSTYRAGTAEEIAEHWRKFDLAKANFVRKWGAEPQVLEARWKRMAS